jgi:hypothetical protein
MQKNYGLLRMGSPGTRSWLLSSLHTRLRMPVANEKTRRLTASNICRNVVRECGSFRGTLLHRKQKRSRPS